MSFLILRKHEGYLLISQGFCVQQRVSRAPPLLSSNRFSVLSIHDVPNSVESAVSDEDAQPIPKPKPLPVHRPNWEKRLASKLVIRSLEEGPNSIRILVHLKTTDTLEAALDAIFIYQYWGLAHYT